MACAGMGEKGGLSTYQVYLTLPSTMVVPLYIVGPIPKCQSLTQHAYFCFCGKILHFKIWFPASGDSVKTELLPQCVEVVSPSSVLSGPGSHENNFHQQIDHQRIHKQLPSYVAVVEQV